jgi:retron-type reverse transcriptase
MEQSELVNNRQGLVGGGRHRIDFDNVISLENLLSAWRAFAKGKRSKKDVSAFELNLEDNIFALHQKLVSGVWRPEPYTVFFVQDPKLRRIHKASVFDRVLYQAVYQAIYPIFDRGFIHDSYASRNLKGTHRGVKRFEVFARKVTQNYRRNGFVLKCDIRKFFDSIDHKILLRLLGQKIIDSHLLDLLEMIIRSFNTISGKGLPLGNVTSQVFANIYLNELDQYLKHTLKVRYYIRYCDDFVILSDDNDRLKEIYRYIDIFLDCRLKLSLHPNKVTIKKISQGTDFLGYVSLPYHRVLRTNTKHRMLLKIENSCRYFIAGALSKESWQSCLASYFGMLGHSKSFRLRNAIIRSIHDIIQ